MELCSLQKKIVTELVLPLLTLSALVETAVYKLLCVCAKALKRLSERPSVWLDDHKIVELKDSRFFTISWTVAMLYHNLVQKSLSVDEYEAEKFLLTKA